jgi:hypothetical protein
MNTTNTPDFFLGRATMHVGAAMMMAWTLMIGGLGFILFIGVYYAMMVHSQGLLLTCCILLLSPLFLTFVFGGLKLTAILVGEVAPAEEKAYQVHY